MSKGLGQVERRILEHVEWRHVERFEATPIQWLAYHAYRDPAAPYEPADSPWPWPTEAQFHAVRRAVRSLEAKGYLRIDRTLTVKVERDGRQRQSKHRRRWSVVRLNQRGKHAPHPGCILR